MRGQRLVLVEKAAIAHFERHRRICRHRFSSEARRRRQRQWLLPSGFHANCWIEVWLLVSCMRLAAGHVEHEDLVVLVCVLNEESNPIS